MAGRRSGGVLMEDRGRVPAALPASPDDHLDGHGTPIRMYRRRQHVVVFAHGHSPGGRSLELGHPGLAGCSNQLWTV
jgi:hypothetical protein